MIRFTSRRLSFGSAILALLPTLASAQLDAPVGAAFRHVDLHVDPTIVLEIRHIDGALSRL